MTDLRPGSEITDGIHWFTERTVNYYLIEHEEDLLLLDTGWKTKGDKILKYIKTELESRNISKILLTHHHKDHTAGAAHLEHHLHPTIYCSEEDAPYIRGEISRPLPKSLVLKFLLFPFKKLFQAPPVSMLSYVQENDEVDGMKVLSLPGHTAGSIGFLRDKHLFSGDAAVSGRSGRIIPGVKIFAEDYDLAISTYHKMAELEFEMLLPGHGTPILEDAGHIMKESVSRVKK